MRRWLTLALLFSSAACADDSFSVQRAPEFPRASGTRVSVFGVYKDGRLAPEAWDPLRAHLTPIFGTALCEPGYPDMLTPSGTPVLNAVDDFARANGVTDELLDRIGPTAKGDVILLIMETGRPSKEAEKTEPAAAPAPTMRGAGRRGAQPLARSRTSEASAFEMVAVLFSPHAHKSVGAIRMTYSGSSMEDAVDTFFRRVGGELPGAKCEGWTGDLHLEVSDVRRLETE